MRISINLLIAYLIFIFQGLISPLGSVMIIEIAGKYGVDTSTIGYILALGIVGGGAAAISSGFLLQLLGQRRLILLGIFSALLGAAAITGFNSLLMFALGMFLSGASMWFLAAVANYIVVQHYQGEKRSSQMNLLNFFFSLGALSIPTVAAFMLAKGIPWEFVFLTPLLLLGFLVLLVYLPSFAAASVDKPSAETSAQAVSTEKWNLNIYLTGISLGVYCMLEYSYTSWIVVHLRENVAVDIVAASVVLTTFYICQAVGRLASGFIVKHVALNTYIIACALIGAATISVILFSTNYTVILALTVIMSLAIAGLYPSILSYGTLQVKRASPTMMTFFMTSGIIGSVIVLLLTSFLKQRFGVLACIGTGAITAAVIVVLIGITKYRRKKSCWL